MSTSLWIERTIGVATLLQTLEYWAIRDTLRPGGIWNWAVLRREFVSLPRPLLALLDRLLSYEGFMGLLGARFIAAALLLFFPHGAVLLVLLFSTLLISMRWRGTFNGGSDYMTLIVLIALCVGHGFSGHPRVMQGALVYVALQVCLSFFIAGWVKLKSREWRQGRALSGFLNSSYYDAPPRLRPLANNMVLVRLASWGVILFECAFPLALWRPELCLVFVGLALLFQLANVYLFGLNRFVWAWAAAYPALYYCSQWSQSF